MNVAKPTKTSSPVGQLLRPADRQQFREHISNATIDRKVSQRFIQKEAFKNFSEQINARVF